MFAGLIVSLFSIFIYRKDETTTQKGELYWAAIAPFIWPNIFRENFKDLLNTI